MLPSGSFGRRRARLRWVAIRMYCPAFPISASKVPTGGGKTFLACNAVRPVFDALPFTKTKAVVWLVPSDAILTQTVKTLKDPATLPAKVDADFGGRVEVYTKQELLNGQNFNPTAVTEQLSIMVLSYDSFRGRGKESSESLSGEQQPCRLCQGCLGTPEMPIRERRTRPRCFRSSTSSTRW